MVLLGAVIALALFFYGLHYRRKRSPSLSHDFVRGLVWASLGLSAAITFSIVPTVWLLTSLVVNEGGIDKGAPRDGTPPPLGAQQASPTPAPDALQRNMPPGFDTNHLLAILMVGAILTLYFSLETYRRHLDRGVRPMRARGTRAP